MIYDLGTRDNFRELYGDRRPQSEIEQERQGDRYE